MKRIFRGLLTAALILPSLVHSQEDKILELGKTTYQSCVACHGPDGKGVQAGDLRMAPSLHESAFVKGDHAELLTAAILKGILKENNDYVQAMLPLEAALDDEQVAALVAFVTKEFGGKRRSPTANEVARWRKKYADQASPWKRGILEEMLETASAPKLLTDLKWSLYEGKWEELPDFSKLEPVASGTLDDGLISLDPAKKLKPGFGMVFEGKLHIPRTAEYRFSLTSDDGSALAIDGETVVGNDGIHPAKTQNMKEQLEEGEHTLKVLYFDGGGQRFLSLQVIESKLGKPWLSSSQTGKKGKSKSYDPIPLAPRKPGEAIVHRAFLPDANPRAIAIGFPESVHAVWDADVFNLAYLYRGEFMDASPHWNGRGSGSNPLGTDRVKTGSGLPFQVLESLDEPWVPESKATIKYERDNADPQKDLTFNVRHPDYRFRGYRLDGKRIPTFRYDYRDLEVTDRFDPAEVEGVRSIVRTVTVAGKPEENLWMRLASTGSQSEEDGWIDIGGNMKIRVEGADPVVRQVGSGRETLVPVEAAGTLTVIYRWNAPQS